MSGSVNRELRASQLVREVVASGKFGALETWWHSYGDEDWAEADRLLASAGVGGADGVADREFGVISEGERQHVLLARALMSRPEVLLLDEPAAGLDMGARERLLSVLGSIGRQHRSGAARAGDAPHRGDTPGNHPRRLAGRWADPALRPGGRCPHLGGRVGVLLGRRRCR